MQLRFRSGITEQDEIDLRNIRARATKIHERVGQRNVRLTDLFAMIGEDDMIGRRNVATIEEPGVVRVLPKDV